MNFSENGETVSFEVRGIPIPKGSMKAFMPRGARYPIVTHDNSRTKPWASLVGYHAQAAAPADAPWFGPVRLFLRFLMPRPKSLPLKFFHHTKKPDLDKLCRCIKDSVKGILYEDDSQVVMMEASKEYSEKPGVTIVLSRINPKKDNSHE